MALIFARLARNYVKAGYFPTDEASIQRISNMLCMPESGSVRMLDPCCGEGTALADVRHLLVSARGAAAGAEAFGIELDPERARHAKQLLDRVIRADVHDVVVKPRSMSLLFLNPPYGYGVSDAAAHRDLQAEPEKAERLERTFLRKTVPYLAYGGTLVYIVHHYALDDEIRAYLVRNFVKPYRFRGGDFTKRGAISRGQLAQPTGLPTEGGGDFMTKAGALVAPCVGANAVVSC